MSFFATFFLSGTISTLAVILLKILVAIALAINVCTIIKRSHDFGSSGYINGGIYAIVMAILMLSDVFAIDIALFSMQQ